MAYSAQDDKKIWTYVLDNLERYVKSDSFWKELVPKLESRRTPHALRIRFNRISRKLDETDLDATEKLKLYNALKLDIQKNVLRGLKKHTSQTHTPAAPKKRNSTGNKVPTTAKKPKVSEKNSKQSGDAMIKVEEEETVPRSESLGNQISEMLATLKVMQDQQKKRMEAWSTAVASYDSFREGSNEFRTQQLALIQEVTATLNNLPEIPTFPF